MSQFAAAFAVVSLINTTAVAQTPNPACFSEAEFADVLISVAPAALKAMGQQCSAKLHPGMVLGNPESPVAKSVEAASREAWPRTLPTLIRVMKVQGGPLSPGDAKMTRDAFTAGIGPMLGKIIANPDDCIAADKMLKLAEPLPPRSLAGILVQIFRLTPSGKQITVLCPPTR